MADLLPVYLIVGDDDLLVSRQVEKLRKEVADHSVAEFSVDDDFHLLIQALTTPPMFEDRRLVILRGADRVGAEGQRSLFAYLENPSDFATLVLVAEGPAGRLAAQVRKSGHVIEAGKGKPSDLFAWLAEEGKSKGLRLSAESMAALRGAVGDDRSALSVAVDELRMAFGDGRITPAQVKRQFGAAAPAKVWGMVDAVVARDPGAALAALNRLTLQGEPPQVLVWALIRNFRMLMVAGERPPTEVSKLLGLPPWRAEKLVRQARGFTPETLIRAYRLLAAVDWKLKRSEEPASLTLERAVVAIATPAA
ncbi:MAG: DNA polymerase III subunit delta [Actinomycetota bacterium]